LRPIDDYSQSQVNSTVTLHEKPTVDNPDVVCSIFIYFMQALAKCGKGTELVARSLDLTSAYRQLCIEPASFKYAYVSVFDPTTCAAAPFQQIALPFGSRTAVNAFIRCARFLQWVAARCLAIPMSCYFDDFVIPSTPGLAGNTQQALSLMFDLLGWAYDRGGDKADVFSSSVAALGVVFDLSSASTGTVLVANTSKRTAETVELIGATLANQRLSHKQALVLRGRPAFCDAQVFGRTGQLALQAITQHAYKKPFDPVFSDHLRDALLALRLRISSGPPRSVSSLVLEYLCIFTDAAFQDDFWGGLGGVICTSTGSILSWFGMALSSEVVSKLMRKEQQVAIGELETLAVLLAANIWRSYIGAKRILFFVDNEGSRFSLIRGYSASKVISFMCSVLTSLLDDLFIFPWYARVPSVSNIADPPSRGKPHESLPECRKVDQERLQLVLEECLEKVVNFHFVVS